MFRRFTSAVLVAMILVCASFSWAGEHKPEDVEAHLKKHVDYVNSKPEYELFNTSMLKPLALSDSQKEEIKNVAKTHWTAVEAWKAENKPRIQELYDQSKAAHEAGDKAKAKELAQQAQALRKDEPSFEATYNQIMGLLTEDQRQAVKQQIAEARQKMIAEKEEMLRDPEGYKARKQAEHERKKAEHEAAKAAREQKKAKSE